MAKEMSTLPEISARPSSVERKRNNPGDLGPWANRVVIEGRRSGGGNAAENPRPRQTTQRELQKGYVCSVVRRGKRRCSPYVQ